MPTVKFYSSSGDGYVGAIGNNWDILRGSGGSETTNSGTEVDYTSISFREENSNVGGFGTQYIIRRPFLAFDTSGIPDDATITSATLNLYVLDKYTQGDGPVSPSGVSYNSLQLDYGATQSSVVSLALTDFSKFGTGGDGTSIVPTYLAISSIVVNAYNVWTLPGGLALASVSKTGYTKFSIRAFGDAVGAKPSHTNYVIFASAENPVPLQRPYLEVIYSSNTTTSTTTSTTSTSSSSSTTKTGTSTTTSSSSSSSTSTTTSTTSTSSSSSSTSISTTTSTTTTLTSTTTTLPFTLATANG